MQTKVLLSHLSLYACATFSQLHTAADVYPLERVRGRVGVFGRE